MFVTKTFDFDQNRHDFLRLLEFRYTAFVKELNYLPHKPEFQLLQMEYDQYDIHSRHIILEQNNEIVACARIIKHSDLGLPVLERIDPLIHEKLVKKDTVEVSRLIIKKEYRSSFVYIRLLQAIFDSLLESKCKFVLADTFVGSESYKLLVSLGLKKASKEYNDIIFSPEVNSIVLYFIMNEMLDMLSNYPNRKQTVFLKSFNKHKYIPQSLQNR